MWLLAWRLKRCGFDVHNWGYFSLFGSIEKHSQRFEAFLTRLQDSSGLPIHIVAHSMGSIICRQVLLSQKIQVRRVVMLTPPNQGSHVASRFSWLGKVVPAIAELSDRRTSYVCNLREPSGYEIAIIQAQYDFLIHESATLLSCAKAITKLPVMHSGVLYSRRTFDCVVNFIRNGSLESDQDA